MVIDPMRKMVALNVINQLIGVTMKLSAIVKIRKYKGLHEGHHFISIAMEVHGTPRCDMDRFIKVYVCLFHDRQSKNHLSFFFAFSFLVNVLILLFNVL
jgi:hypothetical protein